MCSHFTHVSARWPLHSCKVICRVGRQGHTHSSRVSGSPDSRAATANSEEVEVKIVLCRWGVRPGFGACRGDRGSERYHQAPHGCLLIHVSVRHRMEDFFSHIQLRHSGMTAGIKGLGTINILKNGTAIIPL